MSDLFEHQTFGGDSDVGHFGDDRVHDLHAGQREGAIFQDLGLAVFGGVFHGNDHAAGAGDQVHRAAHAFDHFARNHPVGKIALFVDFHRAKHAQIDVASANHGEG